MRGGGGIGEFELIADYFKPLGAPSRHTTQSRIALGIGDDAALLDPAPGMQLAISVDTLVAGVHFPEDAPARLIAHRALRSNLSDLAAMGATPLAYTLGLSLPAADEEWLAGFAEGLREVADEFPIALIGGDTTRGAHCVITVQIFGEVPAGEALLRSGAQVGDTIFVTGTLGDARAALDVLPLPEDGLDAAQQFLLDRYYRPTPRLDIGLALRGIATAAIDVSDGLAADLGHILDASDVGAELQLAALPLSAATPAIHAHRYALAGGDDYEICFTAPQSQADAICDLELRSGTRITAIGVITDKRGLAVFDSEGTPAPLVDGSGYTHF